MKHFRSKKRRRLFRMLNVHNPPVISERCQYSFIGYSFFEMPQDKDRRGRQTRLSATDMAYIDMLKKLGFRERLTLLDGRKVNRQVFLCLLPLEVVRGAFHIIQMPRCQAILDNNYVWDGLDLILDAPLSSQQIV